MGKPDDQKGMSFLWIIRFHGLYDFGYLTILDVQRHGPDFTNPDFTNPDVIASGFAINDSA